MTREIGKEVTPYKVYVKTLSTYSCYMEAMFDYNDTRNNVLAHGGEMEQRLMSQSSHTHLEVTRPWHQCALSPNSPEILITWLYIVAMLM